VRYRPGIAPDIGPELALQPLPTLAVLSAGDLAVTAPE
jgi:hypothetical protein